MLWKDIEGYEGYYRISSDGKIRSLDRVIVRKDGHNHHIKGRIMKTRLDKDGYVLVGLRNKEGKKTFKVHRLVLKTFEGDSRKTVNHKNGKKSDNRLSNLEYLTNKENSIHALKNGLIKVGEERHTSKLSEKDVREIMSLKSGNLLQKDIAKIYNISPCNIKSIWEKRTWGHLW